MRTVSILCFLFCALIPVFAHAVGLGPITLHSALNQPLDADVEIFALGKLPLSDLHSSLAPASIFRQAGIERPFHLTQLRFKLMQRVDGKPIVNITTKDPVVEPYLNFLLGVTWSQGQVYRDYTLLLDPPSYHVDNEVQTFVAPEFKTVAWRNNNSSQHFANTVSTTPVPHITEVTNTAPVTLLITEPAGVSLLPSLLLYYPTKAFVPYQQQLQPTALTNMSAAEQNLSRQALADQVAVLVAIVETLKQSSQMMLQQQNPYPQASPLHDEKASLQKKLITSLAAVVVVVVGFILLLTRWYRRRSYCAYQSVEVTASPPPANEPVIARVKPPMAPEFERGVGQNLKMQTGVHDQPALEAVSGDDVVTTMLDLATVYIDMGNHASARGILQDVVSRGNEIQRQEAEKLLQRLS